MAASEGKQVVIVVPEADSSAESSKDSEDVAEEWEGEGEDNAETNEDDENYEGVFSLMAETVLASEIESIMIHPESSFTSLQTIHTDSQIFMDQKTESDGFFLDIDVDESKEVSIASKETTTQVSKISLDRAPHYSKFLKTMLEYGALKRLNNFLHKKMADYFKKRKMEYFLIEVDHSEEAKIRYRRKLIKFNSLREEDTNKRAVLSKKIDSMTELRNEQCQKADEKLSQLLKHEAEVGIGLISTKTGKSAPDKLVNKLISNQRSKIMELQHLRLTHIKIRNAIASLTAAIAALDRLDGNHTLVEYEQLQVEHQANVDKVEDRQDQLTKLREKCEGAIQCLAHIKEKCSESEQNIQRMHNMLRDRQMERTDVREQLSRLKKQRDWYRFETQRLKEDNELLTNDKLLIDMEKAMRSIQSIEEKNQKKRETLSKDRERLRCIKMHYDCELQKKSKSQLNITLNKK